MSFKIECPFCGQHLEVPPELENTTVNCPACSQELYLSRDDALEEIDPAVERIRREYAASQKEHAAELRRFALLQQQKADSDKRTRSVINLLLWLFVYWPLIGCGVVLFIYFFFSLIR